MWYLALCDRWFDCQSSFQIYTVQWIQLPRYYSRRNYVNAIQKEHCQICWIQWMMHVPFLFMAWKQYFHRQYYKEHCNLLVSLYLHYSYNQILLVGSRLLRCCFCNSGASWTCSWTSLRTSKWKIERGIWLLLWYPTTRITSVFTENGSCSRAGK